MLSKDRPSRPRLLNTPASIEASQLLLLDDDPERSRQVRDSLRSAGFTVTDHPIKNYTNNHELALKQLQKEGYDALLLASHLDNPVNSEMIEQILTSGLPFPVVLLVNPGEELQAASYLQRGAMDVISARGDYLASLPARLSKAISADQLQRSVEQINYQALVLNNVRDAVVVWDLDGNITYWNPAAEVLFGYSARDRLGKPIHEVYLSSFDPPVHTPGPEQTTGQYAERRYLTPSGKAIWISSRLAVLRETKARNRLLGYMDVSHDITRSRQAEQALRESEARYRAIVEDYQTELICRFTPEGTLTFVNEVYCRYFGLSRDQLLGTNLMVYVREYDRQRLREHLNSLSPNRPYGTLEHLLVLPTGSVRWFQRTDRAILDQHGRIFEFQSVGRDITDRKRMEAQIQAAQTQLVQAARLATLGELASGVAHQINNPLTTIIADAQLLLRTLDEDAAGRESAEAIEQAGWRVLQVVQRLMDFSRPSTDAMQPISVNETIRLALSLVGTHVASDGLKLIYDLQDGLPNVRGHSRQLQDVWVNLILLARDACTDGMDHTILIRSMSDPAGWVQVEVQDDGFPIPPREMASIFEPNFIGPTHGRGTGLELSICREIIRQHNGRISAEPTPDDQTILRVVLPAEEE